MNYYAEREGEEREGGERGLKKRETGKEKGGAAECLRMKKRAIEQMCFPCILIIMETQKSQEYWPAEEDFREQEILKNFQATTVTNRFNPPLPPSLDSPYKHPWRIS